MGIGCLAGLECILGIFKALSTGSYLSSDSGGGRSTLSSSSTGPGSPRSDLKKAKQGGGMRQGSTTDELHLIPGRMFLNGASSIASLFTQQGMKGTNQDAMIVWENFGSTTGAVFCGVFDGHGPYGHIVARRVRDSLPLKLSANWEVNLGGDELRQNSISTNGSMNLEELTSVFIEDKSRTSIDLDEEKFPEVFSTLKESFLKACKVMDKELKLHPSIDCFCSGTTAVTLVKQGEHLVIGNVGDSRAILATRGQNDCLVAVQLTVDLKPNLPKEAERIQQCKGRVFALKDEPEVARVWLPNYDSPGLAMARAFGDFCLKDFGLISVPEISYHRITEKDEFIVLATDGVWDVLSNKEVVDIVASAPAQCSAARLLVQHAVRAWRFMYPTSKVDDCAVVCLFLNAGDPPKEPVIEASYADADKQERIAPSTFEHCGTTRCSQIVQGNSSAGSRSQLHQQMPGVNQEATENTLLTMPMFVEGEKQQSAGTMAQNK